MNMPTSQIAKTTHLARRPAAKAKIERRSAIHGGTSITSSLTVKIS